MKNLICAISLFLTIFFCPSLFATQSITVSLDKDKQEALKEIQKYLFSIKSAQGKFLQITPRSSIISYGELYLQKPGKLKLQYDEPFRIDYYINDDALTQYDYELEQASYGSVPNSPIRVLLYDGINLLDNELLKIISVELTAQSATVSMVAKSEELSFMTGLVLVFERNPMKLTQITRIDEQGNITKMRLNEFQENIKIDEEIFNFSRPKPKYPM